MQWSAARIWRSAGCSHRPTSPAMTHPKGPNGLREDDARRTIAAGYLKGRTLEEALAAWRSDYESPAYRERRPMLVRLGNVIRRLAAEAEAREDAASDHPGQRAQKGPRRRGRAG